MRRFSIRTLPLAVATLLLSGCRAVWEFDYVLWNHSDHDVRVVYRRMSHPQDSTTPDRADTVMAGQKKLFASFSPLFSRFPDLHLPLEVYHRDSLIFRQTMVDTALWDVRRRHGWPSTFHTTYTLHTFNTPTP